jgi:LmbE family N-acetylglucosaminyl deacetylase
MPLKKSPAASLLHCPLLEEIASPRRSRIPADDVAVVVAHPDDETIGCGAHLPRLSGCSIVLVTDGAPRNPWYSDWRGFRSRRAYAQAREQETRAALELAGVPQTNLLLMNIPDQEAAHRLHEITWSLVREFAIRGIRHVLTHSYEGGHPDHDAVAFSVHAAAAILASRGRRIDIIEMPFYRMGRTGRVSQSFAGYQECREFSLRLSGDCLAMKRNMMQCYPTQSLTIARFSASLEKFRLAPLYDFAKLPNGGKLFYETLPWGMAGTRWLKLANRAINDLVGQAAA